jgi:hypothetical protein
VTGELLATESVLQMALQRHAWWPDEDAPVDGRWEQHHDALLDALDADLFEHVKMAYESLRSLQAVRAQLLVRDRRRRPLHWKADRLHRAWGPQAEGVVQQCFDGIWAVLHRMRSANERFHRKDDREALDRARHQAEVLPG